MIVQGRLVASFEAIPTLLQDVRACCVIELNEDGRLVALRVKRPQWPGATRAERDAADLAERAAQLLRQAGTVDRAAEQAKDLAPELRDFVRQLVALEQLRGDEAMAKLGAGRRRPGLD